MRPLLFLVLVGCLQPLDEPPTAGTTLNIASYRDPCTQVTGETEMCFAGKVTGPYHLIGHDYEWGFATELRGERDGDDFIVYEAVSTPDPVHEMAMVFPAPPADGSSPWFTRSKSGLDLKGTLIPCDDELCKQLLDASQHVFTLLVEPAGPYALNVLEIR